MKPPTNWIKAMPMKAYVSEKLSATAPRAIEKITPPALANMGFVDKVVARNLGEASSLR